MIASLWKLIPLRVKWVISNLTVGVLMRIIDLGLRLTSYQQVCRTLISLSPAPDPARVDLTRASTAALIINASAKTSAFNATCLRRSLALWYVLRWCRIPSEMCFGVNRDEGHTWVEHNHQVINDRPDVASQYAILYRDDLRPENIVQIAKVIPKL